MNGLKVSVIPTPWTDGTDRVRCESCIPPSMSASSPTSPIDVALPLFARGVLDLLASWPALRLAVTHGWSAKASSSSSSNDPSRSAIAHPSHETIEAESTSSSSATSQETTSQKRIRMAEEIVDAYYTLASDTTPSNSSTAAQFTDQMEDFLLDFFEYEYGVGLEDGSEVGIVKDLSLLWDECVRSNGKQIEGGLLEKFARLAEKAKKEDGDPSTAFRGTRTGNEDEDDDDDSSSESENEGRHPHNHTANGHTHGNCNCNGDGMDVDGDDAPQLARMQKEEPQVDEDGFTMVSKRRGH